MEELKDRNAYVKATMADGVAILEGTTTWCSQCKAIAPFVDQMMKKYPDARQVIDKVTNNPQFYNYNVEEAEDIAQELGVSQMPTFTIFKDGDLVDGITGARSAALEKAIKDCYDGKVVEE